MIILVMVLKKSVNIVAAKAINQYVYRDEGCEACVSLCVTNTLMGVSNTRVVTASAR